MYNPEIFESHRPLFRRMAGESMVLLKNDNGHLPFAEGTKIAIFGKNQIQFIKGGRGSADVFCNGVINPLDGLQKESSIVVDEALADKYRADLEYVPSNEEMSKYAADNDLAVWVISRNSTEGLDREAVEGDFYLDQAEKDLLAKFEKYFSKRVVVILNICGVISLAELAYSPAISAILYAGLPGMECGTALCDILTGRVCPSGRLVDTYAAKYEDYPSSSSFRASDFQVDYEEGIFVGYRWFESDESEKKKVIYPFGHGLSYTTFKVEAVAFVIENDIVKIDCQITNTGSVAGKYSIGVWASPAFESLVPRTAAELRAFGKTKLLAPAEKQQLHFEVPVSELAFFDEDGVCGKEGAYVVEKGFYRFSLGGSVRETFEVGIYEQKEHFIVSVPGLKLTRNQAVKRFPGGKVITRNIIADVADRVKSSDDVTSSFINFAGESFDLHEGDRSVTTPGVYLLRDVADGKVSMDEFLDQLDDRELIELCQAKYPSVATGTGGLGNLRKFGIPNAQTADGPAGLRLAIPTACFPCATLMACSWDTSLMESAGQAMGEEAIECNIDIMLAPGLNIHRDPLCGRNFEYFSEDPFISGNMAGYMVVGIQKAGALATLKHFAFNNKEQFRLQSSTQASERCLREIYLRNFQYAVKVGNPACIMSSYNIVNNIKTSCDYNLLTGILRDEWGYEGMVMTDWYNDTALWREILAGNDAKMPFGYPEERELALSKLGNLLPRVTVRKSVERVLRMIMKSNKFKNNDLGLVHQLDKKGLVIEAEQISEVSCNITQLQQCQDVGGGKNHGRMRKNQRGRDIFLIYRFNVLEEGTYEFSVRTATTFDSVYLEFVCDGESCGKLKVPCTGDMQKWDTTGSWQIQLSKGEHIIELYHRGGDLICQANIGRIFIK